MGRDRRRDRYHSLRVRIMSPLFRATRFSLKSHVVPLRSVCGSDVHTITEGWGKIETPMIVG